MNPHVYVGPKALAQAYQEQLGGPTAAGAGSGSQLAHARDIGGIHLTDVRITRIRTTHFRSAIGEESRQALQEESSVTGWDRAPLSLTRRIAPSSNDGSRAHRV